METREKRLKGKRRVVVVSLTLFLLAMGAFSGKGPLGLPGDGQVALASLLPAQGKPQKVVITLFNHDLMYTTSLSPEEVESMKDMLRVVNWVTGCALNFSEKMKKRGYSGLDVLVLVETPSDIDGTLKEVIDGFLPPDEISALKSLPPDKIWGVFPDGFSLIYGWYGHKPQEARARSYDGKSSDLAKLFSGARAVVGAGHNQSNAAHFAEENYDGPGTLFSYPFIMDTVLGCVTTGNGTNEHPTSYPEEAYRLINSTQSPVYRSFTMEKGIKDYLFLADANTHDAEWYSSTTPYFLNASHVFSSDIPPVVEERYFNFQDFVCRYKEWDLTNPSSPELREYEVPTDFKSGSRPIDPETGRLVPPDELVPDKEYYWTAAVLAHPSLMKMSLRQFWGLDPLGNDPIIPPDEEENPQEPVMRMGRTHEWVLVSNPGEEMARVKLSFFNHNGKVSETLRTIPPKGRVSVCVNDYMNSVPFWEPGLRSVSVKVESDVPVVAERAQYFDQGIDGSVSGGSCASGLTETTKSVFFADGSGDFGWSSFYCVYNPGNAPAMVTFSFSGEDGSRWQETFSIPGESRFTLRGREGEGMNYAVRVTSDREIVAERAMYRHGHGGGAETGILQPSKQWCFAEGYAPSDGSWRTFVLLQNASPVANQVVVETLPTQGGVAQRLEVSIPPEGRRTIEIPRGSEDFGVQVTGEAPLVAEMTLLAPDDVSQMVGTPGEAGFPERVVFAEGSNYGWPDGFRTYLLVTNFSRERDSEIKVKYLMEQGDPIVQTWTVPKGSRISISTGNFPELQGKSFGIEVTSSGETLATRSVVFRYDNRVSGVTGNNGIPVERTSRTLFFAEGYTGN